MRRLAWCLTLVALAGACGSSAHVSTPAPTSTSTTTSTTTTSAAPPTQGLRGIPVRAFSCPAHPEAPAPKTVPIEGARALLLCPLGLPGQPSPALTVKVDQPRFAALIRALSAADEAPTKGAVCPLYADLPQFVLAEAGALAYQVSIPTDGCGHYQHGTLDALSRARGS